ncbi:MAG: spore germination protein [Acutalibacteraceae bacterium]|nr:spore germination protein [Acutalibacteraceae bacterium]
MNSYDKWTKYLDGELKPDKSFDIIKRELEIGGRRAALYFIDGFIKDEVYEKILEFLYKQTPEDIAKITDMTQFARLKMPYVEVDSTNDKEAAVTAVLSGPSVLIVEGISDALMIDTRTYPARGVDEPQKDKSLRGARDGFVETLVMNTAMIRRRIRDSRLRMEYMQIGKGTKLDVAISYLDGVADEKVLGILRKKLKAMELNGASMTSQAIAEKLQKSAFFNPFPKFKTTERPDYASACIFDGRIVLVMDNSPSVMIMPIALSDFFRETDDYYFQPIVASYTRIIRMAVSIANVIITPLYLLLVNNPQIVPSWLDVIMPNDTGQIPLFLQFLILEFMVDGLRLASLNTPDSLSNSLGIVGGLLLSQFAIDAGWFITEAILFMAFITIASFSLPSFEMGYAMKFERLLLLVLTRLLGIWGFAGGIILIFICMLLIKTLSGRNYLYPIIPFNLRGFLELFIRYPMK